MVLPNRKEFFYMETRSNTITEKKGASFFTKLLFITIQTKAFTERGFAARRLTKRLYF